MCLEWRWGEVCKHWESGRSYHWLCHLRQPHSLTISRGVFQKHPRLATDHSALTSFLLQFLSSFCSADFKGSSTMLDRPVAAHLAFIVAGGCQQRAKIKLPNCCLWWQHSGRTCCCREITNSGSALEVWIPLPQPVHGTCRWLSFTPTPHHSVFSPWHTLIFNPPSRLCCLNQWSLEVFAGVTPSFPSDAHNTPTNRKKYILKKKRKFLFDFQLQTAVLFLCATYFHLCVDSAALQTAMTNSAQSNLSFGSSKHSLRPRNQCDAGKSGLLKFTTFQGGIKLRQELEAQENTRGEWARTGQCRSWQYHTPGAWGVMKRKFTTVKKKDRAAGFPRSRGQTGKELLPSHSSRTVCDSESFSGAGSWLWYCYDKAQTVNFGAESVKTWQNRIEYLISPFLDSAYQYVIWYQTVNTPLVWTKQVCEVLTSRQSNMGLRAERNKSYFIFFFWKKNTTIKYLRGEVDVLPWL